MTLQLDHYDSPVGRLRILFDDAGRLRGLEFEDRIKPGDRPVTQGRTPASIREPLDAYFQGDLGAIERIPVATSGTAFQEAAWAALRDIPPGTTRSYAQQAASIGRPKAVRAIGLANGANPVAIVNPCHRVIGAGGGLTGYGGGLDRKRWLLAHEGAL